MTYSDAQANYVGELMSQATGIPVPVASTWAKSESGVNNNPYGLTNGQGQLYSFSSLQAGVQAAADWLLNPSSPYGSVRTAIKGGNNTQIAQAIAASPWGPSGYYSKSWPGISPGIFGSSTPASVKPASSGVQLASTTTTAPSPEAKQHATVAAGFAYPSAQVAANNLAAVGAPAPVQLAQTPYGFTFAGSTAPSQSPVQVAIPYPVYTVPGIGSRPTTITPIVPAVATQPAAASSPRVDPLGLAILVGGAVLLLLLLKSSPEGAT